MTKKKAIKWFIKEITKDKVELLHNDDDDWGIRINKPYVRLEIPSDLMEVTESDIEFRRFIVKRCPMMERYSNVTISILHELGHHYEREIYINTSDEEYKKSLVDNETHFNFPCELAATDWAIKWIQKKKHRKLIKKFERKFFGE